MFFDFHNHVSFKAFLCKEKQDGKKPSCWEFINANVVNELLDSQSSLDQLKNGNVKLAIVALHPPEQAFCTSGLLNWVLPEISPVNSNILRSVADGVFNYFDYMNQEYAHLLSSKNFKGKSFRIISKAEDILFDDTLNLALSVEGAHCFISTNDQSPEARTRNAIDNLKVFRRNVPVVFITLSHLAKEVFCTHAFGMKLKMVFRDKRFYPVKRGLTEYGEQFIRAALSKDPKRILIDIKHMSYLSRKMFYEMRSSEFPDLPIIMSHGGVVGSDIDQVAIAKKVLPRVAEGDEENENHRVKIVYRQKPGVSGTMFNPSSINLYDHEIKLIVASGGLIGVSMDQRILGYGKKQKEFFSYAEYISVFGNKLSDSFAITEYADEVVVTEEDVNEEEEVEKEMVFGNHKNIHFKHVCNTIAHIVKTGGAAAWDCICLGSDYDGFIDPIDGAPSIDHYHVLEEFLYNNLGQFLRDAQVDVPQDINLVIRKFLFLNGEKFLRTNS